MIADRPLYLDRSRSRLVTETDPAVGWLLVWKGHEIPAAEVKRLGLAMVDGRVQQGAPEPEPEAWQPVLEEYEAAPEVPEPIMPPQSRRRRRR